jgi:isopentenyl-diphosphate delta-isomerase
MVIGSGGIRSGMDAAKAIAFGADLASAARPILAALVAGGVRRAERAVEEWALQLRGAMFLTGSKSIAELQRRQLMLKS